MGLGSLKPTKTTWYNVLLVQKLSKLELCTCSEANTLNNLGNGREVWFPCCRECYRCLDQDLSK